MKHNIGIMQGRLTPSKGRGIQFFPFDNWENEFCSAQKLGLDEIEFVFDYGSYKRNPLWTDEGILQVKRCMDKTGIQVNTVCFDYFMRRAFYKAVVKEERKSIKKENTEIIRRILVAMNQLGITLLEVPLVDSSSLQSEDEKESFREWILDVVNNSDMPIRIALETDLKPKEFLEYLKGFGNVRIGANYDSGNSSGIGYDAYEEVTVLKDYIFNIHIKDRIYHGGTVQLGTGDADFARLFCGLKEIGYQHNFILQAARGDDGEEEKNINEQKEFILKYIEKYSIWRLG